jgi:Flp pilus assembly protein TadB
MSTAVLLGAFGGAGALLVASGWWPATSSPHTPRWRAPRIEIEPDQVLLPLAGGVLALLLTRWPAAVLIGVLAGRAIATRRRPPADEAARAEAIALLIEQLKNAAGAADGVETVLGNAARHAPAIIRDDVRKGTERLPYAPLDVVLDDLADALAHPSGDQVVRAIGQVAMRGGSLQGALDRLAKRTRGLAEMHRRIEVAREQPRSTMRTVTAVIAGFTGLLFLGAKDWMSAYDTPVGQVVLLFVAAWFAFWFHQMGRLARLAPIERYYARGGRR